MVQVLLFWILGLLVGEKWKKEGELITCLVEPISLGELVRIQFHKKSQSQQKNVMVHVLLLNDVSS